MAYLVVRNNSWGKGPTLAEAKRQYRNASSRRGPLPKDIAVYEVPDDYWIDDYGIGHGSAEAKLVSGKDERN